jgi:D-proline reductase (dithiol) PrdB
MAYLENLPQGIRNALESLDCPKIEPAAFVQGPSPEQSRVAIVTTAALSRREDKKFVVGEHDYRVIPGNVQSGDLVMSHVSPNYDRTGFQQDINTVFPIERLRDLAADGEIGSVAAYHYSLMGSTDPRLMESTAENLAEMLKKDAVNTLLLSPV